MALDERYITSIDLEEYFVDNVSGLPLSGGTIEFWVDENRSQPKPVYQISGSPPNYTYSLLPNPITLSPVGTVVNASNPAVNVAIYYYPYDEEGNLQLYYVVVRDSSGNVQLTREAWPNLSEANDPADSDNNINNELSNSQFVDVLFDPEYGLTISETGAVTNNVYSIAPDWDLLVSTNGAATVTVNRTSVTGSANLPTNPPYTLDILAGGGNLSSLKLRQRLNHNPDIWASGYVAGYMVISSLDGNSHTINMLYSPSIAPSSTVILNGSTLTSGYQTIFNTVEIDPGANTENSDIGYVDIILDLPVAGEYNITSLQITGLNAEQQNVLYQQEPVNRQEDHLFNYYNSLLQYKPIPTYLTGWNFGYNPAQILGQAIGSQSVGANKSYYSWDQTIVYQSVDSAASIDRGSDGTFKITATVDSSLALVQYIGTRTMKRILQERLGVGMRGYSSSVAGLNGTVSLWYTKDANVPDIDSSNYNSLVLTLDANGKPSTFNGNWTEIKRKGRGDARFTLNSTPFNEEFFNGWYLDDISEATSATYVAIVIGFQPLLTGQSFSFDSISLCPGDITTISPATTFDEEFMKCEHYYETSYNAGVVPGTVTTTGAITYAIPQNTNSGLFTRSFVLPYRTYKFGTPLITLYSPTSSTPDLIRYYILRAGVVQGTPNNYSSGNFTSVIGRKSAHFTPSTTTNLVSSGADNINEAIMSYHYVIDSRIGIL